MIRLLLLVLTTNFVFVGCSAAEDEARLWSAIRSGEAFAIMRHELAPGTGDPTDVVIDDCTTQRNLDDQGRTRSRATGARFRKNDIVVARVFTSQWCRCRETAELLGLGTPVDLAALNSFYELRQNRAPQMKALHAWLGTDRRDRPMVLVTHQVVISALTGRFASSGEIIVVKRTGDKQYEVLGRL